MRKLTLIFCLLGLTKISFGQWTTSGSNIYNSNAGYVGIGTVPSYPLDVAGSVRLGSALVTSSNSPFTNSGVIYSGAGMHNLFGVDGGWSTKYFGMKTDGSFVSMGGNFGIGTTSPVTLFEVKGNPIQNWIFSAANSESTGHKMYFGYGNSSTTNYGLYLTGGRGSAGQMDLAVENKFYVMGDGKVGIGTSGPTNRLTLAAPALGTGNDVGIDFSTYNGAYAPVYARIAVGVNTATVNGGTGYLGFSTINANVLAEHMRISAAGYVGIGTTSPTEKLSVNGKIRAKEIKVETGWADFVFEPGYKLRSLSDTEDYIKKNKHLPEIPSAKEVEANGINVGEMNAKLLQKIEELTLYVIELKKDNDNQQMEINQLKSKP